MAGPIVARGCFIVEIKISKDDDIELTVESEEGTVTLDDCVELSRIFEEKFSRDEGDYSLTVASAGLDQPFKVPRQYTKAIGSMVEVSMKGGKKIVARLTGACEDSITVQYTALEKRDGSKKKAAVEHTDTFPMAEVNSVRYHIDFN